jgi:hypothetical protein
VNKAYPLLLSILHLLLGAFLIITFDQKNSIVYAQQLDTNDTEILISKVANSSKANATEGAATKANLIKTASDKELKYCYKSQFGSLGTEEGQFNRPHDIVFDSKGFLYINDRELNTFQKIFTRWEVYFPIW